MSRPAGRRKKPPAAASSATSNGDDDYPKLDFDMGDIEAELEETSKPAPVRRSRGTNGLAKSASSASSSAGGSRRTSPDRDRGSSSHDRIIKMAELDRWRWVSKNYTDDGDQDEIRLAENLKAWAVVPLPDFETTDISAALQFRKYLWKNKKLVRNGIPPQYRLQVWSILSGAKSISDRLEHLNRYQHYLSQIEHLSHKTVREIQFDVPRAMNSHPKYVKSKEGQVELSNVLSAFAVRSPNIGYVNSLSHIAGFLLLFYQEEEAFWTLCALADVVLPPDYFTQSLLGVRADCMLMKLLVFQRLPKLHQHFTDLGVDVYNIALKWLMTLYLLCLSKQCIARIFDVLFTEGANILISIGLAFFCTYEKDLLKSHDIMGILTMIGKFGVDWTDNDELMRVILKDSRCKLGEEEDKRRQTERAVMENQYTKELQKTQLHRRLEEEKRKEDQEAQAKREKEEEDTLAMGIEVHKLGHYGDAKLTTVVIERVGADWQVSWKSKRKKDEEAVMKLSTCSLYFGLRHGQFAARPDYQKTFRTAKKLSFSLINDQRSLDLVCQTSHDIEAFKKLFFRANFPLKNQAQVSAFRRRLEKKKTQKRMRLQQEGKLQNNTKVESDSEDYDHSGDETEEKSNGSSSSSSAAASSSSAAEKPAKKPSIFSGLLRKSPSHDDDD